MAVQASLFGQDSAEVEEFDLPDAEVRLFRGFLSEARADRVLSSLLQEVAWRQDEVLVYGKKHSVPRLHQWYGDEGTIYRWSGLLMRPLPWTPLLAEVKGLVEEASGAGFNSLLLNLYRDGDDTVGWHADDEPALGQAPTIASLSLGASRDFRLRHVRQKGLTRSIHLDHGSLLVMAGPTQRFWQHSVPRRRGVSAPRVNLTFRRTQAP